MVRGESPGKVEWFEVVEWFGAPEIETDEAREHRIDMEIVVDAYDEQERAMGWYYYLEGKIHLPPEGRRRGRGNRHASRRGVRARGVRRDALGQGRFGGSSLPARSDRC